MTMRAALYGRISQDREQAGVKVEAQLDDGTKYAEARGWIVAETFRDDDTSAYRGRVRRGFKSLCAAIEAKRVDVVVVTHYDRLFRSNLELEGFIALIEKTGVVVYSVQGASYDLSNSDGQFMARIIGAAAQKESADKSRRIRAKQVRMAEEGRHHGGGRRPFGYEPGGQVVRKAEAELIREAADRVLKGESTWSILREWTERGVPTVSGSPWNNRSLTQLLTSARAAGRRSHHGVIMDGAAEWPAILSEDIWLGVRAVLTGRSKPVGKRPTYMLSGMCRCTCGSKMVSQNIRGRRRYTCVSGPSGGCGKTSRDALRLEAFVTKWVGQVASYGKSLPQNPADIAPEVAAIEARIDRLYDEKAETDIWTDERFKHQLGRLEAQLATARDKAAEQATSNLASDGWRAVGLAGWWPNATPEQKRATVQDAVQSVKVLPVGRGYRGDCNFSNTEILWTDKGQAAYDALEAQAAHDALEQAS